MEMLKISSILVATFFLGTGLAFAEDLVKPHTFTSGTKIMSSDVNENFDALINEINMLKQKVATLEGGGTTTDSPCTAPDLYGFCDNGNGTVTDAATGLVLLKNANCFGLLNWNAAMSAAATLASGACGLTDGSKAGDWRLPTYPSQDFGGFDSGYNTQYGWSSRIGQGGELEVLWKAKTEPVFSSVKSSSRQGDDYWSSTTYASRTSDAWFVNLYYGGVSNDVKVDSYYVWPVRGGR
ncbi:MAG: DUF1566 domain-containing protein [Magnetococcus sp. DMHC-6]